MCRCLPSHFLLIVCVIVVNGLYIDTPGSLFHVENHTVSNVELILENYRNVTILNSILNNATLYALNTTYVRLSNLALYYNSTKSPLTLIGSGVLEVTDVVGYAYSVNVIGPVPCTPHHSIVNVYTNTTYAGQSIYVRNITVLVNMGQNAYPPSAWTFNRDIEAQVGSTLSLYNVSGLYAYVISSNPWTQSIFSTCQTFTQFDRTEMMVYNAVRSLGFHNLKNVQCTTPPLIENHIVEITHANTPLPSVQTSFSPIYTSLCHVHGLSASTSYQSPIIRGHSASYVYGLQYQRAPIQYAVVYGDTSVASLISLFSLDTTTKRYQYIAKQLYTRNGVVSHAYVHDVVVSSNRYSDELGGWDTCHYTYKADRDNCIVQRSGFSTETDGVCYRLQVANDLSDVSWRCGSNRIEIKAPYSNPDTMIFSSGDRILGALEVVATGVTATDRVVLYMNNSLAVDPLYKAVFDVAEFVTDYNSVYFSNTHPFLIVPRINGTAASRLTSLSFTYIDFKTSFYGGRESIFSTTIYDNGNNQMIDRTISSLRFINCNIAPAVVVLFTYDKYLIGADLSRPGYINIVDQIDYFSIENSAITMLDLVFGDEYDSQHIRDTLRIENTTFRFSNNGVLKIIPPAPRNVIVQNTRILESNTHFDRNTALSVSGNRTNAVTLKNVEFSSAGTIELFPISRAYELINIGQVILSNVTSTPVQGIGLYFTNVTGLYCNATGLQRLKQTQPNIRGNVYDFLCEPGPQTAQLGCKGIECLGAELQAYCIVDKTYPVDGELASIVYFDHPQTASDNCNGIQPRHIYVRPDVYTGPINIVPRSSSDSVIFEPLPGYTGRIIIKGSNNVATLGSAANYSLSFDGFDWINPLGLVTYTPTIDSSLFTLTNINNLEIKNSRFIGAQPVIMFTSLPSDTNYTGWTYVIDTLLSYNGSLPAIRYPNVVRSIFATLKGNFIVRNVTLHGSLSNGILETKTIGTVNVTTNLTDVTGNSHFGSFIWLEKQWVVHRERVRCIGCSGFVSSSSPVDAVVYISWNGGGAGYFEDECVAELQPVRNHPTITTRLPYGNPYVVGTIEYGFLATLWLNGAGGSAWTRFKIRRALYRGFPIGVRLDAMDTSVLSLNDELIYLNDSQSVPRQIQFMNDMTNPTYSIQGSLHDIKIGTPLLDRYIVPLTKSNVCTKMCLPFDSTTICRVSATYTTFTIYQFGTISSALEYCKYDNIRLMDQIHVENIESTFITSEVRPSDTLTIRCHYTNCKVIGHHKFYQACAPSDKVPTTVIWDTSMQFERDANSSADIFWITQTTPTCTAPALFQWNSNSFINPSTFTGNYSSAIRCGDCTSNITLVSPIMYGGFSSTLFVSSEESTLTLDNFISTVPATVASVVAIDVYGFIIDGGIFRCTNQYVLQNDIVQGCVTLIGVPIVRKVRAPLILANVGSTNASFDGMYWKIDTSYSLADVGNLSLPLSLIAGSAPRYGIHLVVNGIQSNLPCLPGSETHVVSIGLRNTINGGISPVGITDPGGVVQALVNSGQPSLYCLIFDPLFVTGIYNLITILALAGAVIVAFLIAFWCFGGCDFFGYVYTVTRDPQLERLRADEIARGTYRRVPRL